VVRRARLTDRSFVDQASPKAQRGEDARLQDFLGGPLWSVLIKLIFLSLLVGAFLAFLDVTPLELFDHGFHLARSVFGLGFDAIRDIGRWVVYGAVIVVPIWLLSRLFRSRG
jgi:hypothetical protein